MKSFEFDSELSLSTKLYRYMSVESFMSFVESKKMSIANVNTWDDPWELVLSKIPTMDDDGQLLKPSYSYHERLYGQCWSLTEESDAMWRIYSRSETGIQISTSVEKFKLVGGTHRCHLGKVVYYETPADLIARASLAANKHPWAEALFKRAAFSHECEVRFLTHGDFVHEFKPHTKFVSLPVDPSAFIENITIDPRAGDWYLSAITSYCDRIGLVAKPVKSTLYEREPELKLGFVRRWVPVHDK